MSINTNYTHLAQTLKHLKNPNVQTGTLLIEVPADVGRAYNGYKRGGVIEGAEKFRKEIMSAFVWLFGIPAFNFIGNKLCEHILKVPMDIDYSNKKLNSISSSVGATSKSIKYTVAVGVSERPCVLYSFFDSAAVNPLTDRIFISSTTTPSPVIFGSYSETNR